MKFKVIESLSSQRRITSIDAFRGVAIISVVLFHFGSFFTIGYIGVDLFFVISGLLIGNLLTKDFKMGHKINFLKFILQRGFKIWPSYYFFLIAGSGVALLLYHKTNPDQIIQIGDIKRYLLFYQNYTGLPFHFSFDHVWSLCVEEHFYILLPLLFILIQFFVNRDNGKKYIFISIGLAIASGIAFKYASLYLTNSKDTYSATHNRIDSLSWGVLLNLIINYKTDWVNKQKGHYLISIAGVLLFALILYLKVFWLNVFFQKIWFHSLLPFSFFLIILGIYFVNFTRLKWLRVISYYSYNWYLWHPLFAIFISQSVSENIFGLFIYLITTFLVAVITTTLIEEPMLSYRSVLIAKWFSKTESNDPRIQ